MMKIKELCAYNRMKNKIKEKSEIRTEVLKQRRELPKDQCRADSIVIAKRLLSLKKVQKAETIFLYASYKNEVGTKKLIQKLLSMKKKVALPRVREKEMDFFLIRSWEELVLGYQEILEPDGAGQIVVPTKDDVMILPGVVFDRKGNRIGYGGGYYDRYLEQHANTLPCLIGIGYEMQIFSDIIPAETFDRQVDFVVTEKKVRKTKRKFQKLAWIIDVLDIMIDFVIELID